MSRFVIRAVSSGVKFDLRAANGQRVLTSEVYRTEAACRKGIESVRKNAPAARIEDQTEEAFASASNPKFELYRDRAGEYRFRLRARNGAVIAASDGYTSKAACRSGLESVIKNAGDAFVTAE